MSEKTAEQRLATFLSKQPQWFRMVLELDYDSMSPEQRREWVNSDWWLLDGVYKRRQQEYESILEGLPRRWAAYRRKQGQAASRAMLSVIPKGKPGRPPNSEAEKFATLHPLKSYREIAKDELRNDLQSTPYPEAESLLIEKESERIRQSVRRSRRRKVQPVHPRTKSQD